MTEHVFLVAVTVTAKGTREEAELFLHEQLPEPYQGAPSSKPYIEEWWIAEDDRQDRSDNASAIFVPKGMQDWAEAVIQARLWGGP